MLPTFAGDYAASQKNFDAVYEDYYNTKQNYSKQTTEKANANNAVYDTAMGLMNDAKKMYRNSPDERAEFTYSSLMIKVRGAGFTKTGYRFMLLDTDTQAPVTTATVLFTSGAISKSGEANELGIARCELAAGTYQFTLTAPGYSTVFGTVTVKDGTMHQKKIRLTKAVASEEMTTTIAAAK